MTDQRNPDTNLPDRVTELEIQFTHLQRTIGDLDEVVRDQLKKLTLIDRRLETLSKRIDALAESDEPLER